MWFGGLSGSAWKAYFYMYSSFPFTACVLIFSAVQSSVHLIWHSPLRASWHCVGLSLDGHSTLKRVHAVYAYDIYVSVSRVCRGPGHIHMLHSSCSQSSVLPFCNCLGAPRGIASVGCWMGTGFCSGIMQYMHMYIYVSV